MGPRILGKEQNYGKRRSKRDATDKVELSRHVVSFTREHVFPRRVFKLDAPRRRKHGDDVRENDQESVEPSIKTSARGAKRDTRRRYSIERKIESRN